MQHFYGRIPDHKDENDFLYKVTEPKALPTSVDLRSQCSPVRDQGQLGSCVGFGCVVGAREFLENKVNPVPPTPVPTPIPPTPPSPLNPASALTWVIALLQWVLSNFFGTKLSTAGFIGLSPLFGYYEARKLEGTTSSDSGAEVRDGLKALQQVGVSSESLWPYNISKFTNKPSTAALAEASTYKINSYTRLSTLSDVQNCLANGNGVVIGFDVYESFESDVVNNTGKMPMPQPGESLLGGHCVFVVGYKNDTTWAGGGYLIVKNSWGTSWGASGFFFMPYAYVTPTNVSDMWVAN